MECDDEDTETQVGRGVRPVIIIGGGERRLLLLPSEVLPRGHGFQYKDHFRAKIPFEETDHNFR